jgi:hypothetical protein
MSACVIVPAAADAAPLAGTAARSPIALGLPTKPDGQTIELKAHYLLTLPEPPAVLIALDGESRGPDD